MSTTKIVFPPPPPTTNTLTSQQRKQLLRSTKKLGRVLGSTPQLLDATDAYGHACFAGPFMAYRDEPFPDPFRRQSMDTLKSSLPSATSSPATSRSATPSSTVSRSSSTRLSKSRSFKSSPAATTSKVSARPPLLRLAFNSLVASTPLETIPASPLSPPPPVYSSFSDSLAGTILEDIPLSYSIQPNTPSPRDSLIEPDFIIPSQTAVRKQKMDRLRRMLGDDVPQELVFPRTLDIEDASAHDDESTLVSLPPSPKFTITTEHFVLPVAPPPPTPRTSSPSKLPRNNSRDSLSLPSVHRAQRIRRVPVPNYDPSLPTTFTTIHISTPTPVSIPKYQLSPESPSSPSSLSSPSPLTIKKKKRLTSVVECPDEHGTGCGEEFSFLHGKSHPYATSTTPYVGGDAAAPVSLSVNASGVSVKLWSTRKGYDGWAHVSQAQA
ncbi:hypothetical protein ONZ45_g4264 [Pleurotus djamor]|nr:hypothetical protein ONZ45_g4264 [Pleurotus djamor]